MIKQRSLKRDIVGFGVPKFVPYKGDYPVIATKVAETKKEKKWTKPNLKKLPPVMPDRS